MPSGRTDLSKFNNDWYRRGAGIVRRALWYFVNAWFFESCFPWIGPKRVLLRWFGAEVGRGVVFKPRLNITQPWRLKIGNHVWIGAGVWIDNLADVEIHDHVCVSQGAMLLTGNHDYKKETFDLLLGPIVLEDGVWIGAKSVVCPGVVCRTHCVLCVGSVATKELEAYSIYQGNPAVKIRERDIQ